MNLIELRKQNGLTQKEAALLVGIPYRTYVRYEENPNYLTTFKYKMIFQELESKVKIDEDHGVLSLDKIKALLIPILKENNINFCYLFGSYAKGSPRENSDIDLLIDTEITGLAFFDLVEKMRTALKKRIDLLRLVDIKNDNPIALRVLKEGIKIL